jgi:hypothetical protein
VQVAFPAYLGLAGRQKNEVRRKVLIVEHLDDVTNFNLEDVEEEVRY